MKWIRKWAYDVLSSDTEVLDLLNGNADRVYSAGSLTGRPETVPFLVIRVSNPIPEPGIPARRTPVDVWAHDRSGGYTTVDDLVSASQRALVNADTSDMPAISVLPQGASGELIDTDLDTQCRFGTVMMVEKWDIGGPR